MKKMYLFPEITITKFDDKLVCTEISMVVYDDGIGTISITPGSQTAYSARVSAVEDILQLKKGGN